MDASLSITHLEPSHLRLAACKQPLGVPSAAMGPHETNSYLVSSLDKEQPRLHGLALQQAYPPFPIHELLCQRPFHHLTANCRAQWHLMLPHVHHHFTASSKMAINSQGKEEVRVGL